MFQDKNSIKELRRLIGQLQITGSHIIFREKEYPITSENATASLVSILYSECYALKETYQSGLVKKTDNFTANDEDFVKLLSQNNHSKARVEQGWQIKSSYPNGYVEVVKQAESRIVPSSVIMSLPTAGITNTGQTVAVYFPKEDNERQPTFYYAFSNFFINASHRLTRIYWNTSSTGAPVLMAKITQKLNHYNIPFILKCLNHPDLYFRRDAAVLYVEDHMLHIVGLLLPEICEEMEGYLEADVPLFACHYNKGVGIAESPDVQESFGMNRMDTVARVLIHTIPQKLPTDTIINIIGAAFIEKGISPLATFLNKGSRTLFN